MTEAEWNSCTDSQKMLAYLRETDRASERKLRLFAVACCRHMWLTIKTGDIRRAVVVAERYADGYAGNKLRETRRSLKKQSPFRQLLAPNAWMAAKAVPPAVASQAVNALVYPERWLSEGSADVPSWEGAIWETEWQRQQLAQSNLVRDIFPLQAVQVLPEWLHWNNRMAVALAQHIYRERASYRMQ